MIRISIVICVLNSPEVVRRQVLHFKRMPMPVDVEWILVDDKSDPPLRQKDYLLDRFTIVTNPRQGVWTQPAARNYGVTFSQGDFLLCTDIDHILSKELIDWCLACDYDFVRFPRQVAVLDEDGVIVQTEEEVTRYGFEPHRYQRTGFWLPPHTNTFLIRKSLYLELGGVGDSRKYINRHPNLEEVKIRKKIVRLWQDGKIKILDARIPGQATAPTLYMIPNGQVCGHIDYNPFGLFHSLKRRTSYAESVGA